MLTGDENIVDVNFVVFWRIKDAPKYLFNMQNPETTVKEVAESAMREVVGQSDIQPILTGARQKTEQAVQKLMQDVLDYYGAGIRVDQVQLQKVDPPTQVIDAFRDVQAAPPTRSACRTRRHPMPAVSSRRRAATPSESCRARAVIEKQIRGRSNRPVRPLPEDLRGIQEGARGDPQAHVP